MNFDDIIDTQLNVLNSREDESDYFVERDEKIINL